RARPGRGRGRRGGGQGAGDGDAVAGDDGSARGEAPVILPVILIVGDPRLRRVARRVETVDAAEADALVAALLDFRARAGFALSELLQHEIDHLDGVLAVDRALDTVTVDAFRRDVDAHLAKVDVRVIPGAAR